MLFCFFLPAFDSLLFRFFFLRLQCFHFGAKIAWICVKCDTMSFLRNTLIKCDVCVCQSKMHYIVNAIKWCLRTLFCVVLFFFGRFFFSRNAASLHCAWHFSRSEKFLHWRGTERKQRKKTTLNIQITKILRVRKRETEHKRMVRYADNENKNSNKRITKMTSNKEHHSFWSQFESWQSMWMLTWHWWYLIQIIRDHAHDKTEFNARPLSPSIQFEMQSEKLQLQSTCRFLEFITRQNHEPEKNVCSACLLLCAFSCCS